MLLADGGEGQKYLAEKLEELKEMKPIGKATAYVCENFTCKAPVTSVGGIAQAAESLVEL